jgi:leucyl-tRNA synthetase
MPRYSPAAIEPKWQKFWEENQTFAAPRLPAGEKKYVLDMFPYPSGDGLHVGHPEGYTATDIMCRYWRMRGVSVMHPMGFDAFGLPAEEHAIKTNTPPRIQTEKNIATFRRQLKMLGFSYDWERELATTDVEYFRWTQWIFLQIYDTWFDHEQERGRPISELPIPDDVRAEGEDAVRRYQDEHRLAYQTEAPVNWCPALGTVLANEEVQDGKSERGGHPVVRMPLRQWMLRITAYAERLEKDLETLNWSEGIKTLQRNWIGRSTGADVDFYIGDTRGVGGVSPLVASFQSWLADRKGSGFPRKPGEDVLRIYTTRPDTLFGATYMVIAPEHPFVERLTTLEHSPAVRAYCEQAARKSDLDRTDLAKTKTGVFTGSYAINPVNGEAIPIWVADYVLISYGTGAIMAVPGQDERDWEFAEKFDLPIIRTVQPTAGFAGKAYLGDGPAINSQFLNGLHVADAKRKIIDWLEEKGLGASQVNYKLRDWLFSRQRFWGEPFPILHELDANGKPTGMVRAVREDQLPLDLPHLEDFKPHGRPEPPLEKAPADWLYPVIDGKKYKRETNTMPQWAGSCWYYLRFLDPKNGEKFVDPEIERSWMPIDLYVGGAEHAVLHLLYARFWHKVLYDRGHVSTVEPFQKLVNQGMILGEATYYPAGAMGCGTHGGYSEKDVVRKGGRWCLKSDESVEVVPRAEKMSKSRGNVINPDAIVKEYGADSLRLYEMFMGPLEAAKPWSMEGVNGVRGFLDRVWRMIVNDRAETLELNAAVQDVEPTDEQSRVLHKTIKAVTDDIEAMAFNTAIARMMEFTNYFGRQDPRPKSVMEQFILVLSPFAPHLAEELWRLLGHNDTLAYEDWPEYDEALTRDEVIEVPVQINGKLRSKIQVLADITKEDLEAAARADVQIATHLAGKTVAKVIVVPGRLVNFVAK